MSGRRNSSSSSSDVEVIEDSEPERQERLAKLRLARQQSQKGKGLAVDHVRTSQATTHTQMSVPPASTRTESVVSSGAPPREGEGQSSVRAAKSSSLPVRKPAPPPWLASTTTSTLKDPQTSHTSSGSIPLKSSSQPSPIKQFDLNSFAYQKRTIGRSASYSTSTRSASGSKDKGEEIAPAESCFDAPKPSASSTKASSSPKVFILGATKECPDTEASFTSEQIAALGSCIVCEHAWTARKLPKHKWSHITSCARKGGCDLDTLYVKLIAAVVDASDAKVKKSTKGGKEKEKEKEPIGPQSLLAQTIQGRAPPKKRGRRVEPGPSILQPVGDTHKTILERGEALLGVTPVLNVNSHPNAIIETPAENQATEEQETQGDEPSIPATQAFAPSNIGGRSRLLGSTLATLNMDSRSGLFYADLPCAVSPASTIRLLSTLEPSFASNLSDLPVPLIIPRTAPSISTSDSSIISISSSSDSEPNPGDLDNLDNRIHSPVFSDSSASVIILDSTRSYISRQEPGSPSSPVDSTSFHPTSRRQSFGEEWNSQEGVYMWEEYNPSRPPSPPDSLADYIYELSLRENDAMLGEVARGRSRSPRPLSKPRSRSRRSSRSSKKGFKPPAKRSGTGRKKSKSPQPGHRSGSRGQMQFKPTSRKAKAKGRPRSQSKSRSRSKSRVPSPKPRKRRTARQGSVYAPEDGEDGPRKKELDARLLDLILQDKELYLRILRYEPIKFEDILNMAIENGIPKHGLQIKLKAFLDSQCINFYTAEALGRKKKRPA